MIRRPIEELLQGEIFSINPKSRKLVLSSIDPKTDAVVVTALEKDLGGFTLSFNDIQGHVVFVWEKPAEEKAPVLPEAFDRVACTIDAPNMKEKRLDLSGTILTVDAAKLTACVLWDSPIMGQQVRSECLTEIRPLGIKASGTQLDFSQKVAVIIKEGEQLAAMDSGKTGYETVKNEIIKEVAEETKKVEASVQKNVDEVVRLVIDANLEDLKRIEQAGTLMVTSGEHNYQINEVGGFIHGYQDYIFNRVADTMKVNHVRGATELQVPVTTGVMKVLADNMINSYFLTRDGYITEEGNKWAIYSKNHELLGTSANRNKALGQIRTRDYRIRKGLEA